MRFYTGVVEDRMDPMKLGRCRVRVVGIHTHNKQVLPTQDLPWAMPVQPLNSGAMSGIGKAPVGPVEGTWVVIFFQDEDNQFPMMMGTIGGIPQQEGRVDQDTGSLVVALDNNIGGDSVVFDNAGNAQYQGTAAEGSGELPDPAAQAQNQTIPTDVPTAGSAKPGNQYTSISQRCINDLKKHEGLAKRIGNGQVQAYPDPATGGAPWTIGYGTTRINGAAVTPRTIITEAEAERIFTEQVRAQYLPAVTSRVRAVVTQGMIDAMTSFVYNVGAGNFAKSSVLRETNAGNYQKAAEAFMMWTKAAGRVLPGLVTRRREEAAMYLADGIPGPGNTVDPNSVPPESERPEGMPPAPTPVGEPSPNGGTSTGAPTGRSGNGDQIGFKDPNEKYPRYINEPDTNRLARHEFIEKTVVMTKEAARLQGIETARGVVWDQAQVPYNAEYPFNHVWESESGHIQEFDDTPGSERYHLYHRAGTFHEIDHNGTEVNRIVGDFYEIVERNGFIYIAGQCDVTVDGAKNLLVKDTLNIDIWNNCNVRVYNDATVQVGGYASLRVTEDLDVKAKNIYMESEENFHLKAGTNFVQESVDNFDMKIGAAMKIGIEDSLDIVSGAEMKLKSDASFHLYSGSSLSLHAAANTNIKADGAGYIQSSSSMNIKSGGNMRVDYSRGNFGEGASGAPSAAQSSASPESANPTFTGNAINPGDVDAGAPQMQPLSVNTRQNKEAVEYDTEDEQTPEAQSYMVTQARAGAIIPQDQAQVALNLDGVSAGLPPTINNEVNFGAITTDLNNVSSSLAGAAGIGAISTAGLNSDMLSRITAVKPLENFMPVIDKSSDFIKNLGAMTATTQLSDRFNLGDLTRKGSVTLQDHPAAELEAGDIANNLKNLTVNCLDPIKKRYPSMKVMSALRHPKNPEDVSQHTKGEAVDIRIDGLDRQGHYEAIQEIQQLVPYDELILEYDGKEFVFIHISLKKEGNRKVHYTMFHHQRKGNYGEFIYIPEAK